MSSDGIQALGRIVAIAVQVNEKANPQARTVEAHGLTPMLGTPNQMAERAMKIIVMNCNRMFRTKTTRGLACWFRNWAAEEAAKLDLVPAAGLTDDERLQFMKAYLDTFNYRTKVTDVQETAIPEQEKEIGNETHD